MGKRELIWFGMGWGGGGAAGVVVVVGGGGGWGRGAHSWELTEEFLFEKAELILNFPEGISTE